MAAGENLIHAGIPRKARSVDVLNLKRHIDYQNSDQ